MTSETLHIPSVTVQLTPEELHRFRAFIGISSPAKSLRDLAALLVVIVILAYLIFVGTNGRPITRLSPDEEILAKLSFTFFLSENPWLYFVAVFFAFCGFISWKNTRPAAFEQAIPGLFKPRTLGLTEHGFLAKSDRGEVLNYWHTIIRLVDTKKDIYVMVAPRDGYILPKRCFETPEAMAIFQNQLHLYLEKFAPASLAAGKPS